MHPDVSCAFVTKQPKILSQARDHDDEKESESQKGDIGFYGVESPEDLLIVCLWLMAGLERY